MSGFGVDPTQQAPDPSQVFQDPSQVPALQGAPAQPAETGEQPEQPGDVNAETLDAEINVLEAIETGCEMCIAASTTNSEDFMRFAQGVQFLSVALKNLQPQPAMDPAAAQLAGTAMRVDQAHAASLLKAEKDLATARAQHSEQQLQSSHQSASSVPEPPNRPAAAPPSARG